MNAMSFSKIIMREGSRYKIDINIEKINETGEAYANFISVKLNNKVISVPIKNTSNLSDDEAKFIASKYAPLCIEEMKKVIKDGWVYIMDNPSLVYSDKLVNEMIIDLFDLVNIAEFKNEIIIEYCLNSRRTSHNKYSRKFFSRYILIAHGKYKNGVFDLEYCIAL